MLPEKDKEKGRKESRRGQHEWEPTETHTFITIFPLGCQPRLPSITHEEEHFRGGKMKDFDLNHKGTHG